jgi:S-adenosylmethionine hydrolase
VIEPPHRITLLTDFGTADGYVAAMKGVIAARTPAVPVDDASHDIAHGDVSAAAAALAHYWQIWPPGTVHVVVVDPGVGSARRAIAVRAHDRFGIAPDNGVLEPMLACADTVHEIVDEALFRHPVSATFHGRDIFAPVAAYLAAGGLIESVGPRIADAIRINSPLPVHHRDRIEGVVVHVDHFGNLITNIRGDDVAGAVHVVIGEHRIGPVHCTYSDVEAGQAVALIASSGFLEIAVRDGNAARALGLTRGAAVIVSY